MARVSFHLVLSFVVVVVVVVVFPLPAGPPTFFWLFPFRLCANNEFAAVFFLSLSALLTRYISGLL